MIPHMDKCILLLLLGSAAFGADIAGIWMGSVPGRAGEKQDIAFQFKLNRGALSGTLFGDEFDLPLKDIKVDGDRISFSTTSTNYYSGSHIMLGYTGTVSGTRMELTRDRKNPGPEPPEGDRQGKKEVITLKRITP
jgi:hypothetical protein